MLCLIHQMPKGDLLNNYSKHLLIAKNLTKKKVLLLMKTTGLHFLDCINLIN